MKKGRNMKKRKIIDVAEVRAAMEELISYKRGRFESQSILI